MSHDAVAFESTSKADERKPGAYSFLLPATGLNWPADKPIGIVHACPCGCSGLTALYFAEAKAVIPGKDVWTVTGSWPKVTLAPSIGIKYDGRTGKNVFAETGKYHWHGFLENGVFVER